MRESVEEKAATADRRGEQGPGVPTLMLAYRQQPLAAFIRRHSTSGFVFALSRKSRFVCEFIGPEKGRAKGSIAAARLRRERHRATSRCRRRHELHVSPRVQNRDIAANDDATSRGEVEKKACPKGSEATPGPSTVIVSACSSEKKGDSA
ncbi:hypothetical protein MRX96_033490 [Rhipicephalus microplus]